MPEIAGSYVEKSRWELFDAASANEAGQTRVDRARSAGAIPHAKAVHNTRPDAVSALRKSLDPVARLLGKRERRQLSVKVQRLDRPCCRPQG